MKVKRIKASKTVTESCCYPSRAVLLEIKKRDENEFSAHLEVFPQGKNPYLIYGNYAKNIEKATEYFNKKLERFNMEEDPDFEQDTDFMEI